MLPKIEIEPSSVTCGRYECNFLRRSAGDTTIGIQIFFFMEGNQDKPPKQINKIKTKTNKQNASSAVVFARSRSNGNVCNLLRSTESVKSQDKQTFQSLLCRIG